MMASLLVLAVLAVLLVPTGAVAEPKNVGNLGNASIAPSQSRFRGLSYSEWSAAWFQWVFSLPVTDHPLFDTADCSAGQTGNVWFIDGTHGTAFPEDGRHCTIPAGTALFLAVAARNSDNEGCAGLTIQRTAFSELELREFARDFLNGFLGTRAVVIDGVAVEGLPECDPETPETCNSPYRVQSPVFDYIVPAVNNILVADDGDCYKSPPRPNTPYTARGAVADGVYVLIKPLSVGQHTIKFGPLDPETGEPTRVYFITVTPR
jgi:hypothetical protein